MANNNLEKYLEAILDKIADGTETDIPRPSWNIEKYLAAIYEALSSGGSGGGGGGSTGGGVLVCHGTITDNGNNTTTYSIDKTWKEIHDAEFAVLVWITSTLPQRFCVNVLMECKAQIAPIPALPSLYSVKFSRIGDTGDTFSDYSLVADSETGYPSYTSSHVQ